jgi:TonB family protein
MGGLALVMLGLTGSVLVFYQEFDRLLNPSLLKVRAADDAVGLDRLVANAQAAWPEYQVNGIALLPPGDPDSAVTFWLQRDGEYVQGHLNPYTGEVLGLRDNSLMLWLLKLHSSLFLKEWGETLIFTFGVGLMLSCVSGVVLSRDLRRVFFTPRLWGRSARLVLSDWHKLVGVTALLFNLVLGFTGAWMNWEAVKRVVTRAPKTREERVYVLTGLSVSHIVAEASRAIEGFRPTWFVFPEKGKANAIVLGMLPGAWLYGPYGSSVSVDSSTGTVREITDIRKAGLRQKFQALIAPLHFGNFGGLPLKLMYFIGGLTPAFLAATGTSIWWRRRRSAGPRTSKIVRAVLPESMETRAAVAKAETPSLLAVSTMVIWLSCFVVGLSGFALPYSRPAADAKPIVGVQAELLQVELTSALLSPPEASPPPPELTAPPPRMDPLPLPELVPLIPVAEPSKSIAFPIPVERPTRIVEAREASTTVAAPAPPVQIAGPPAQTLTYGQGEGRQPAPEYPRQAIREGQEGTVVVRFIVSGDGHVLSAEAVRPSPWPMLNDAALRAIRHRWRFRPGEIRVYEVSIRFELTR